MGARGFSSPPAISWPLTICVSKRHSSSFYSRWRQGWKLMGTLSSLDTFLVSRLKLSHAERGTGRATGLRRSWQNGFSVVQPHAGQKCGCGTNTDNSLKAWACSLIPASYVLCTIVGKGEEVHERTWLQIDLESVHWQSEALYPLPSLKSMFSAQFP